MLGEDLDSMDKLFWIFLFVAVVIVKALLSGSRIPQKLASWWELRASPVKKSKTEEELREEMMRSRQKMMAAHEANADKWAAEREAERLKKLQAKVDLEKKIAGEDVDDSAPAPLGPSKHNRPSRNKDSAPYKLASNFNNTPARLPRRGGGGG